MEPQPTVLTDDEPIVLINIRWMKEYKGPDNDPTIGGHGYLKTHKLGHEAWNLEPIAAAYTAIFPARLRSSCTGSAERGAPSGSMA